MTFRTESRIKIVGSVHEAFAYLCDVGRWPEWAPTVLEGRVRGGGRLQPEYQLRPLLHPRGVLKRTSPADPASEHRRRRLRPAPDVGEIRHRRRAAAAQPAR